MRKTTIVVLIVLVVGLGLTAWFVLKDDDSSTSSSSTPTAITTETGATDDSTPSLIIGDEAAPITIIEYGDFQCPICKRFFEQTEPTLLREYIDTGKAKIEFRVETHIGPESVTAGEAAYCAAEQDRFKNYHDELYGHQGEIDFTTANLKSFAGNLGLDQAAFDDCLDSGKYNATVVASNEDAQERISGTPTFFIGEQRINGAQPIGVFRAILDNL